MITGLFKGSGRVRTDALRGTWDVDGTWWCNCAKKRPYVRCFCVGCGLRRPLTTPSPEQRFWKKVNKTEGCWLWTGSLDGSGYGQFWNQGKTLAAHRWSYEMLVGPIPLGLQIDHLCRTPTCVNPSHLEPVTQRENVLRWRANKKREAENEQSLVECVSKRRTDWRPFRALSSRDPNLEGAGAPVLQSGGLAPIAAPSRYMHPSKKSLSDCAVPKCDAASPLPEEPPPLSTPEKTPAQIQALLDRLEQFGQNDLPIGEKRFDEVRSTRRALGDIYDQQREETNKLLNALIDCGVNAGGYGLDDSITVEVPKAVASLSSQLERQREEPPRTEHCLLCGREEAENMVFVRDARSSAFVCHICRDEQISGRNSADLASQLEHQREDRQEYINELNERIKQQDAELWNRLGTIERLKAEQLTAEEAAIVNVDHEEDCYHKTVTRDAECECGADAIRAKLRRLSQSDTGDTNG